MRLEGCFVPGNVFCTHSHLLTLTLNLAYEDLSEPPHHNGSHLDSTLLMLSHSLNELMRYSSLSLACRCGPLHEDRVESTLSRLDKYCLLL